MNPTDYTTKRDLAQMRQEMRTEQLRQRSPAHQRRQQERALIGERLDGETRAQRRKRIQMAKRLKKVRR